MNWWRIESSFQYPYGSSIILRLYVFWLNTMFTLSFLLNNFFFFFYLPTSLVLYYLLPDSLSSCFIKFLNWLSFTIFLSVFSLLREWLFAKRWTGSWEFEDLFDGNGILELLGFVQSYYCFSPSYSHYYAY